MKKIKKFLKTGILLLGISLLLSNCEKDEILENTNDKIEIENSNLRINKISFEQLQQLKNLENPIKRVLKNFDINTSKKGIKSKSSIDANDGSFTILTDEILQVETDSTKTYTFRIETPTDPNSSFENFVIDFPNENYYYFYIYKYVFDENSTEDFPYFMNRIKVNENLISFSSLNNLAARGTTCGSSITMVVVSAQYTCSCCGRKEIHPTCTSGYDERQIFAPVITYQGPCGTTGEAIYPDNNGETTYSCDTCGSNGTTQGTGDSNSTTGVLLSFEQLIFQNFVKYNLNIAEKSWINDIKNLDYQNQISNFLNNNLNDSELDYTIEAKNFVKEAIEAIINGGDVDWVDKIINNLKGKTACVYGKLEELNLFKETIGKFIANPNYHIQINNGECPNSLPGTRGCSNGSYIENGLIIINISSNYGPNLLDLAQTILHEGIHAELTRYLYNVNNNLGLDSNNDRPRLMELYMEYKGLNSQSSQAQHYYMTENYVKPIAAAIRELDNNKYPIEYYMGFGWDGLARYGLKSKMLTETQILENERLQKIVNNNTLFNNECN